MKLGARGESLIKSFERLRLIAFKPRPEDPWTIGWGRTRGVHEGMTISDTTAEVWFHEDVANAERIINSINVPLTQSQFDALVSLVYNVGGEAVSGRSTIGRALRAHDWRSSWKGFALWTATPGAELGQARRRTAEMALFLMDGRQP